MIQTSQSKSSCTHWLGRPSLTLCLRGCLIDWWLMDSYVCCPGSVVLGVRLNIICWHMVKSGFWTWILSAQGALKDSDAEALRKMCQRLIAFS